jgi:hypothetical protein
MLVAMTSMVVLKKMTREMEYMYLFDLSGGSGEHPWKDKFPRRSITRPSIHTKYIHLIRENPNMSIHPACNKTIPTPTSTHNVKERVGEYEPKLPHQNGVMKKRTRPTCIVIVHCVLGEG